MKVLVGGLLGAVVSVAAWIGLEKVLEGEYAWLALAVGLITGLATSISAGKTTSGAYLRGGLAAILTLAAIYSVPKVKEQIMHAEAKRVAEKVENVANNASGMEDGEPEASDGGEQSAQPKADGQSLKVIAQVDAGGGTSGPGKSDSDHIWEMGWMCGAALIAYLVGKGSGEEAAVVAEGSSDAPQDAPPQDTGDEGEETA